MAAKSQHANQPAQSSRASFVHINTPTHPRAPGLKCKLYG